MKLLDYLALAAVLKRAGFQDIPHSELPPPVALQPPHLYIEKYEEAHHQYDEQGQRHDSQAVQLVPRPNSRMVRCVVRAYSWTMGISSDAR